jgi:hypothetical protein
VTGGVRLPLRLHPDSLCAATQVDVELARPLAGTLVLSYTVTGKIEHLRIPPAAAPTRTDGLWQSTCFEAFLRTSVNTTYYEFNFAPSAQWAAYRFDGYRNGMRVATDVRVPRIETQTSPGIITLQASLDLDRAHGLPLDAMWHLGLSALLEDTSGGISYWALAHPPGKADFHHADCFAHEFAPAWNS